MIGEIIKQFFLLLAFCYIKLCNILLPRMPVFIKKIISNIFLEFLTIWAILEIFVGLKIKHPCCVVLITALFGAIVIEFIRGIKTIIEHYNEFTERQYNNISLKDAYKKLKTMPFKKLVAPTMEETLNILREKSNIR